MMLMDFPLSMRSAPPGAGARRWSAAAIAAAVVLACPSLAGAGPIDANFDPPANDAAQFQVVCVQKLQRNCVLNWQALPGDPEAPGASEEGPPDVGPGTLLTQAVTDELWPDFAQWADDLMYRRWTRPIGVRNPVDEGGSPGQSPEPPDPIVAGVPPGPLPDVLILVDAVEPPPSAAVPEPSSLSLLLASMAVGMGVLARARRRSTQK
jgi:hypothetical protein